MPKNNRTIASPGWKSIGGKSRRFEYVGKEPTTLSNGKVINPGDTVSRREYEQRQLQRQKVGHISEKEKIERARPVPTKKFATGDLFVFEMFKETKTGYTMPPSLVAKNIEKINTLLDSLPDGFFIQFHYRGNVYQHANEDYPIDEWGWSSTELIATDTFKKYIFPAFGHNVLNWMGSGEFKGGIHSYTFPEIREDFPRGWSYRMHGKTVPGLLELHITIWESPFDNKRGE